MARRCSGSISFSPNAFLHFHKCGPNSTSKSSDWHPEICTKASTPGSNGEILHAAAFLRQINESRISISSFFPSETSGPAHDGLMSTSFFSHAFFEDTFFAKLQCYMTISHPTYSKSHVLFLWNVVVKCNLVAVFSHTHFDCCPVHGCGVIVD